MLHRSKLSERLAYSVFLFLSLACSSLGLMMLFSPRKLINWLSWLAKTWGIALEDVELKPSFHWDWRIGGLGLAIMGIYLVKVAFSRILRERPSLPIVQAPPPLESYHPNVHGFVIGLVAFLSGFYLLARPRGLLRWMLSRSLTRQILDDDVPFRLVLLVRVIGFLWMLATVLAVFR